MVPLPFVDLVATGISVSPDFLLERIFLLANANVSTQTVNGEKRLQYRYILIPGSVVTTRTVRPPDWNDYNKVKAFYGLKD